MVQQLALATQSAQQLGLEQGRLVLGYTALCMVLPHMVIRDSQALSAHTALD
ncbi:TPA: hypothetical protein QDB28_002068 [Burkholderia vietnamiensis]|uniref:hypothetical protein n=1 Tax=Burkholderia vietnamiensis TaxID=60552 RepID=UPI00158EC91D|nr:hypothetical protein [Burkholderia vietnamiensis]HDR9161703.1 hypothetical protein [Burkholderia vietnamiensis]